MPWTTSGGLAAISAAVSCAAASDGVGVVVHVVDEADLLGARRVDVLAGQREFAQVAVADDRGQTGEAAHVGDDRDLDLTDAELGVGAGVADVDSGDQVDAAADAPALDGGDDRLAAVGDGVDAATACA